MMTILLDEQRIRRRRGSRNRGRTHRQNERALGGQSLGLASVFRRRLVNGVRLAGLILAVGSLTAGLVIVGLDTDDAFARPVVSPDFELAGVHGADSGTPVTSGPERAEDHHEESGLSLARSLSRTLQWGVVEFERTEDTEYVVQEGETLSEIAERFDLPYDVLAEFNRLPDPHSLVPDQQLLIPGPDSVADLGV